jgi:hypothetical protein
MICQARFPGFESMSKSFFTTEAQPKERKEEFYRREPRAAKPQPKLGISPAKAQSRKEIKLPNLAWREQIPVLDSYGPPENLRKQRKL